MLADDQTIILSELQNAESVRDFSTTKTTFYKDDYTGHGKAEKIGNRL